MANLIHPVSVVIPAYNEADKIAELLQLLLMQAALPHEIIVVDSGSTDNTIEVAQEYWAGRDGSSGVELKIIPLGRSYPGASRNAGIKQASQAWIALIDVGIIPDKNWLQALWQCANESDYPLAYGYCRFSAAGATAAAVCALSYGYNTQIPVIPSSIFHRDIFDAVGLFRADLRSTEDIEWEQRLLTYLGLADKPSCVNAVTAYRDFPNTLSAIFSKWRLYEKFAIYSDVVKRQYYIYIFFIILSILSVSVYPPSIIYISLLYIVLRVFADMLRRSQDRFWWVKRPLCLLMLVPVAIVIDAGKVVGSINGLLTKRGNNL